MQSQNVCSISSSPPPSLEFHCSPLIRRVPILFSPHQSIESPSSSKTEGEVGEKRDQVVPTTTVHLDPDTNPLPYFLGPSQLELTPGNLSQKMYMSEHGSSSLNVPPSSFFHPSVVGQNSLPVYSDHEQPLDVLPEEQKTAT